MAKKDLNRSIKVLLDGSDASKRFVDLTAKADELTTGIAALNAQGKGQSREAKAMEKQLQATTTQMDKAKAKISETERVMNNLETATKKELQVLKRELEQRVSNTRGTEEYSAAITQLNRVKEQLAIQNAEVNSSEESLKDKLMNAPGVVGVATKSFYGLGTAMKALLLNPVGAFLAGIAAVIAICVKGFNDFASASEEGGLKAASALAPIKVIGTAIGQAFKWVGGYVAEVIDGIGKGIYKVTGWLSQYSDKAAQIHDNMTRQYEIEKDRYAVQQQSKSLIEEQAKTEADLAELKMKSMQKDKYSLAERKQFINQYIEKENYLMKLKEDHARAEYELFEKESAQDDNTYDDNVKLSTLRANMIKARTEGLQGLASIERRRQSLLNEITGTETATAKAAANSVKEQTKAEEKLVDLKQQALDKINSLVQNQADSELSAFDRKQTEINRKYALAQADLDKVYAQKLMTEEEYQREAGRLAASQVKENAALATEATKEADKKIADERIQLSKEADEIKAQLQTDALQTAYEKEMAHLDKLHAAKLLSDKEHEKAALKLKLNYMQQEIAQRKVYLSMATDAVGAIQNAETARLEAKMQNELKLAGDDADRKAAIEKRYAQEKLDIQKKYADVNFAIRVAEIVSTTAAGVMQCFAQLGPIGGAVAAVMVGATGAAQIAAANAERKKVKSMTLDSSADNSNGGSSASVSGSVRLNGEYGGVSSGNEVMPDWSLNSTPTINASNVSQAVQPNAKSQDYATTNNTVANNASNEVMSDVADLLRDLKTNGVKAPIVLSDIEKKQELLKTSQQYGSK